MIQHEFRVVDIVNRRPVRGEVKSDLPPQLADMSDDELVDMVLSLQIYDVVSLLSEVVTCQYGQIWDVHDICVDERTKVPQEHFAQELLG